MGVDLIGYGYAGLVMLGGVMGYVKAGSLTSLVAGLVFGMLSGLGAHRMSQSTDNFWISLGTSGTLSVVMGARFLNSWKLMPAGLMAGASLLVLAKICLGLVRKRVKSS